MCKLFAAALILVAPVSASAADVSEAILVADDECSAEASAGVSPESPLRCGLSALQLRAEKADPVHTQRARAPASMLEANRSIETIWPLSPSPKYDATCFGSAGAEYCGKSGKGPNTGSCVCDQGCMGANGNCYPKANKPIGKAFSLSNKRWPNYKMYFQRASVFGQLKLTSLSSSYNLGQDKFTLYELPGDLDGQKQYFLASDLWKDHVVAMQNTGGTSVSLWAAYAFSLTKHHQPWNLRDIMLRVCSARSQGHPDAIMIGTSTTFGGSTVWAYAKSGTYLVYGYWYPERLITSKIVSSESTKDGISHFPGKSGYWIPSPPIKRDLLPDC